MLRWGVLYLGFVLECAAVAPPIIDISSLYTLGNSAAQVNCVEEIDSALKEFGVFIAIGHTIGQHLITDAITAGNELFSLPLSNKLDVSVDTVGGIGRGYLPFGRETGVASYFEPKEGFSYGYDFQSADGAQHPLQRPNVWPNGITDETEASLEQVFGAEVSVALSILSALSAKNRELVLQDPVNYSIIDYEGAAAGGDTISIMRLFHYLPESSASERDDHQSSLPAIGSSPHTDWGYLTLIVHDGVRGLQFFHDGVWNDVPVVADGIVVNGGDFLSLLSRGRYQSPIHRVLCPPESSRRLSFVLFFYPGYNTSIPKSSGDILSTNDQGNGKAFGIGNSFQFNTLLVVDSEGGSSGSSAAIGRESNFGDYIMKKWLGVLA